MNYATNTNVGGEVSGNYATLNQQRRNYSYSLSQGNLKLRPLGIDCICKLAVNNFG